MAKKKADAGSKAEKVSKSDLIRATNAENPGIGPTDVARLIEKNHGLTVSPAMVSTVLSQDRSRGGKPARRGRPPKSGNKPAAARKSSSSEVSIEKLLRIKKLADEMGGVAEAKRALDALSEIMS